MRKVKGSPLPRNVKILHTQIEIAKQDPVKQTWNYSSSFFVRSDSWISPRLEHHSIFVQFKHYSDQTIRATITCLLDANEGSHNARRDPPNLTLCIFDCKLISKCIHQEFCAKCFNKYTWHYFSVTLTIISFNRYKQLNNSNLCHANPYNTYPLNRFVAGPHINHTNKQLNNNFSPQKYYTMKPFTKYNTISLINTCIQFRVCLKLYYFSRSVPSASHHTAMPAANVNKRNAISVNAPNRAQAHCLYYSSAWGAWTDAKIP